MKHLDQFEKLINKGVGFVFMHYAVVPIGRSGDLMLKAMGGYFETHWSTTRIGLPRSNHFHTPSPASEAFHPKDEWYYHYALQPDMKGVTPIISAHPPQSTMNRKDGPHSNNPHHANPCVSEKSNTSVGPTSAPMAKAVDSELREDTTTRLGAVMIGDTYPQCDRMDFRGRSAQERRPVKGRYAQ